MADAADEVSPPTDVASSEDASFSRWFRDHVARRVVALVCAAPIFDGWRRANLAGLRGVVLEIGYGTGANRPWYPAAVGELVALEPSTDARERARQSRSSGPAVRFIAGAGERIDLPDASVDAVVMSFTLCSVRDPARVLAEAFRVVRPGGELRLLEHGRSPRPRVARWQDRLNALEQRLADGCQLVRDPAAMVAHSPWTLTTLRQFDAGVASPWTYLSLLRARREGDAGGRGNDDANSPTE